MKKILLTLAAAVLAVTACQKPQYVEPTADRQGLTSLTAVFTFGPEADNAAGRLDIADDTQGERYVIPIPYYYPETSDDETAPFMTRMRVLAELQPNCSIEPALSILDLTKDNAFTYTNAKGVARTIIITGTRVHSSLCDIEAFSIVDPPITGIVNKTARKVSLISADDLAEATATVQVSAHATIAPDPAVARDYNSPVTFTVTAADGVTTAEYTVAKETPQKIDYGFRDGSLEQLFEFDPVSRLSLPDFRTDLYLSMGCIGRHLVLSLGDGSTPVYLNKINGTYLGEIELGSAEAGSVASDESGNLLICNFADDGETVSIYRTGSVTEAPTLYTSFTNASGYPMGHRMKVNGSLDGEAQIVLTGESVTDGAEGGLFTYIPVTGGTAGTPVTMDISAHMKWRPAPMGSAAVAGVSSAPADGWFACSYDLDVDKINTVTWFKEDGTVGSQMPDARASKWDERTPMTFDGKVFNNAPYMAMLKTVYFPSWGNSPELFVYDATGRATFSGDYTKCSALVIHEDITSYQTSSYRMSYQMGDVILAPSEDGFTLNIYYIEHNCHVLGGYTVNCIKLDE